VLISIVGIEGHPNERRCVEMMNALIPRDWLSETPGSLFRDLFDLRRDFDLFFDRFFGAEWSLAGARWPYMETYTKDGNLHVRLDLPGVDPADLEVSLLGDTLTVRGERRAEQGTSGNYREVQYGRFERSLRVPEGIDPDKVSARYSHGVLEVILPLPESVRAKRVPIEIEHHEPAIATKKAA
jgi:HSP20 family protein